MGFAIASLTIGLILAIIGWKPQLIISLGRVAASISAEPVAYDEKELATYFRWFGILGGSLMLILAALAFVALAGA